MMRIVERVRGTIPHGGLRGGVVTLVAGTGFAQLIVILSSPILTRLYSPADYGAFAVAISVLSVLLTITCLRYEFAIPLPEADVEAANVLALCLVVAVCLSSIAAIVLWLAGGWLLRILGAPELGPYVMLIPLGQLGGGAVGALTFWAIRTRRFADIAAMRVTQSGVLVATQVGFGLLGAGAPGLLVGDVSGRIAGSNRLALAGWRSHSSSFRQVSRAGIMTAARRYRRFPILSSPSAILNTLANQAPLLLLVALYSAQVGGQYALADRLCSLPLTLIAGAVAQVFVAESARLAHEQPEELRRLYRLTTVSLARTAFFPAVGLAVVAPLLAGPIFGSNWQQAGVYVAILAPMYYLTFVTTATGDVLSVLERQDLQLGRELLRFAFLASPIVVAAALGLPPVWAIVLLSVMGCTNYALYGLFSWRAVEGNFGRGETGETPRAGGSQNPPADIDHA
jgi:O-antigen/teichoic acid export membrane protein